MRVIFLPLALLAAAILGGIVATLLSPTSAQGSAIEPVGTSMVGIESALALVAQRMDRLTTLLEMEGVPHPDAPARTQAVPHSSEAAEVNLGRTEALLDRLEQLQGQVGQQLTQRGGWLTGGPAPLVGRGSPTNWPAFESLFDDSNPDAAHERARKHFILASLGEVVADLGDPIAAWTNKGESGIYIRYEREPRLLTLRFVEGYVVEVHLRHD